MRRPVFLALAFFVAACSGEKTAPSGEATAPASAPAADAASHTAPKPDRLSRAAAGTPAPETPLETGPDGATETIADIVKANPGKPVLVNLWATWCAPCLKELPTLDRLAAETRGRLVVVPLSQDLEGWRAVSKAFTAENYPNLATRVESQMAFGAALGLKGLPVTILYDAKGREVWRYNGDFDWTSSEARKLIGI
jgi:thiol-disulfide isomerase/thioredoxin